MSVLYLLLDTETTGLFPRGALATDTVAFNNARVVQWTGLLCDQTWTPVEDIVDCVLCRDGFSIDNAEFHGITNARSDAEGIPFTRMARELLYPLLRRCTHIVAHNAEFDLTVLQSELYRYQLYDILYELQAKTVVCTMLLLTPYVGATNRWGQQKWPTLAELYLYAMKTPLTNAHNSRYDVLNLHAALTALLFRPATNEAFQQALDRYKRKEKTPPIQLWCTSCIPEVEPALQQEWEELCQESRMVL